MTSLAIGISGDDGEAAPGLAALHRAAVAAGWRATVLAPRAGTSNLGTARAHHDAEGWNESVPHLPVTPSDAVRRIIDGGAAPVDLVLTGVNHGPNTGWDLLHSGTFGGALVASWFGIAAVATSLDDVHSVDETAPGRLRWDRAARLSIAVGHLLHQTGRPHLVNLNVPNGADLTRARATNPRAGALGRLTDDQRALADGWVSVTAFGRGDLAVDEALSEEVAAAIETALATWTEVEP